MKIQKEKRKKEELDYIGEETCEIDRKEKEQAKEKIESTTKSTRKQKYI